MPILPAESLFPGNVKLGQIHLYWTSKSWCLFSNDTCFKSGLMDGDAEYLPGLNLNPVANSMDGMSSADVSKNNLLSFIIQELLMIRRSLMALLMLVIATGVANAQEQKMTPELLWKLGRLGDATISPDGNHVAYSVRRYKLEENKGSSTLFREWHRK